ncbi:MAG: ATP-binding protein [Proteobacteria bacterium]|nr:ATP-binding protein [Pseudomonadota bacterium]
MKSFGILIDHATKPIGIRLTIWYSLAVTVTLACAFAAAYTLLQNHLILGLDLQNASQFKSVKVHLSRDSDRDDPTFIDRAMRVASNRNASIFFYDIRNTRTGAVFLSGNLRGQAIPSARNGRVFAVKLDDVGELRVGEFEFEPFTVKIGTPLGQVTDAMDGFTRICLALLAAMMLMSVAIGFGFSRLALNPIRVISETAKRIHLDNLNQRIPVADVHDEMSDLARILNQMFDRLESSFKQIRQFAAEASHELKSPLSLVRLHAEKMLMDGGLSPVHEDAVRVQLEELARLDQIIEELLFLSRAEARAITLDLKSVNPAPFLQSFAQDARVLAEHYGKRFNHTHAGEGQVAFDDKRLRQVLLNLLSNALNVSPPGGLITLRSLVAGGLWCLSIEDQGPGLPASDYERIFERFVRLQPSVAEYQGSGLGLAICRSIVGLHQGRIFATPGPGDQGLRMVIEIPAQGARSDG